MTFLSNSGSRKVDFKTEVRWLGRRYKHFRADWMLSHPWLVEHDWVTENDVEHGVEASGEVMKN
jgi:hypothetical protein